MLNQAYHELVSQLLAAGRLPEDPGTGACPVAELHYDVRASRVTDNSDAAMRPDLFTVIRFVTEVGHVAGKLSLAPVEIKSLHAAPDAGFDALDALSSEHKVEILKFDTAPAAASALDGMRLVRAAADPLRAVRGTASTSTASARAAGRASRPPTTHTALQSAHKPRDIHMARGADRTASAGTSDGGDSSGDESAWDLDADDGDIPHCPSLFFVRGAADDWARRAHARARRAPPDVQDDSDRKVVEEGEPTRTGSYMGIEDDSSESGGTVAAIGDALHARMTEVHEAKSSRKRQRGGK
ncbi:hypothetical protein CcaverHIS002_0212900 [Cutaneotrichosporon cavernicola]|nr:hypothetical protein CcaverHIS002_0212900 [Cutaneotrichosporon cavernicola]